MKFDNCILFLSLIFICINPLESKKVILLKDNIYLNCRDNIIFDISEEIKDNIESNNLLSNTNTKLFIAEYLKAAASYTKALKQAERDGSEQCVAAKRHHETSRDRVFSRAQTRWPLRRVPRASRLERREEKPLLST